MKIGIIGSGNMGRALGVRLAQSGHEVFFGGRRLEQAEQAARQAGNGADFGTNDEAAEFGDAVIWTMRETDVGKVLSHQGALDGKIVIDLNNRDYAVEARSGVWFGEATAEKLQAALPRAKVVKAFNTIAMESFGATSESLRAARAQTFIAAADTEAKKIVTGLAADLGFEAIDLGAGNAAFRAAEALGDVIRLLMIEQKRGGLAHLVLTQLPNPTLDIIGPRGSSNYQ